MGTFRNPGEVSHPLQGHETKQQFESALGHLLITLEISVPIVPKKRTGINPCALLFNESAPRHTYAYMLRQAEASKKI
jgi:hypothetical protein